MKCCAQKQITFRPGLPSDACHKATWAEVEALITLAGGQITVVIDDRAAAAEVPATADTQCFGFVEFKSLNPQTGAVLTILDGGRLRNVGAFRESIIVLGAPTVRSPLYFDGTFNGMVLEGSVIGNQAGATLAMIEAAANATEISSNLISAFDNTAEPTKPIVHVDSGTFFGWNVQQHADIPMSPNLIEGDNTTSLQISADASIVPVAQALFLGSATITQLTKGENVEYTPAVLANWSGTPPASVADALDRIAAALGPIA